MLAGGAATVGSGAARARLGSAPAKDTWVLAADGRRPARRARLVGLDQVDLADSLPSRAGESLYWLGRYAERAEAVVRLAQVVAAPGRDLEEEPAWVARPGRRPRPAQRRRPHRSPPAPRRPPDGRRRPGRRGRRLRSARRPAGAGRQCRSGERPGLPRAAPGRAGQRGRGRLARRRRTAADARETLERLLGALAAVAGLAQETMVRGPGWFLLDIGRRFERALALLACCARRSSRRRRCSLPAELLEAVLAQSASLIAYRRRYRSDPELGAVVGLLLLDAGNPRSLRFQLDALAHDLGHLPEGGRSDARRAVAASRLGAGRQRGCRGRLRPRPAGARRDRRGAGRAGGDHHRRALRPGPLDQPRVHRPGDRLAAAHRHRGGRRGPGLTGAEVAELMDAGAAVRFAVTHRTRYHYAADVVLAYNRAHLLPRDTPQPAGVPRLAARRPRPDDRWDTTDADGNAVTYFSLERPHRELVMTATLGGGAHRAGPMATRGRATTRGTRWPRELIPAIGPASGVRFRLPAGAAFHRPGRLRRAVVPSGTPAAGGGDRPDPPDPRGVPPTCPARPPSRRPPTRCCAGARASARTSPTWRSAACARWASPPATSAATWRPSPPEGEAALVGAAASHAWCAVALGGRRWLDLDPTNDLVDPAHHVTVAWGRDYGDVAPLNGVIFASGAGSTLEVAVDVVRLA